MRGVLSEFYEFLDLNPCKNDLPITYKIPYYFSVWAIAWIWPNRPQMCKYFERLKFQALIEAITMSSKFSTTARMAHGFPCLSPQGRTSSGMAVNRVCFMVRIPNKLGINIFGIPELQDFPGFRDPKPHSVGFPYLSHQERTASGIAVNRICFTVRDTIYLVKSQKAVLD